MDLLAAEVEIRADASRTSQGIVEIRLQPWRALANDRAEIFAAGSLEWRGPVPLDLDHVAAPRLLLDAHDNGERVVMTGSIPDTPSGRELRAELAERPDASVEFVASAEHREHGVRVIDRAELRRVSAVRAGSYKTTSVEVRAAADRDWEAARWL